MKLKILYSLIIALTAVSMHAKIDDIIYLQSAFSDGNEALTRAIIGILPEGNAKKGAIARYNKTFPNQYKPAAIGLSAEDRQKIIASASKELQEQLKGKDLSNPDELKAVLDYIAGPKGSGGILAKQIGKNQTQSFANALVASA